VRQTPQVQQHCERLVEKRLDAVGCEAGGHDACVVVDQPPRWSGSHATANRGRHPVGVSKISVAGSTVLRVSVENLRTRLAARLAANHPLSQAIEGTSHAQRASVHDM
jgi:hypothetical protein